MTLAIGAVVFVMVFAAGLAGPSILGRAKAELSSPAVIARVIDGDTIELVGGERVRILGIDTAEMPPRSNCHLEEVMALRARDRLRELVAQPGAVMLVRSPIEDDRDVYGRLLRRVEVGGEDVGRVLLSEGLAQRWLGHHATWC